MSNNNNKQRGAYWERRFAERIGGYKTSMSRRSGVDVVGRGRPFLQRIRSWEVKRLSGDVQKQLIGFLDQARDEGADAVVMRIGRRKSWIIVTELRDDEPVWVPQWEAK